MLRHKVGSPIPNVREAAERLTLDERLDLSRALWRGWLMTSASKPSRARQPHALPFEADQTADRIEATVSEPRRAPARRAPDDVVLAWALASAAGPYLSRSETDRIYIAIGVGETFAAIDALVTAIAQDAIAINDDLVATLTAWLDCYVGQDAEPRLRELIAEVRASPPQQASASDAQRRYLSVAAEYQRRRSAGR